MIQLQAKVYFLDAWRDVEIIETNTQAQTLTVEIGNLTIQGVSFRNVHNVALKDGAEVLQSFGAPRCNNPESLAYAVGWRDAYVGRSMEPTTTTIQTIEETITEAQQTAQECENLLEKLEAV
jgi:hypothetical protein